MDFFITEILENEPVKERLLADKETEKEGKEIAEKIIRTGEYAPMKAGMLPVFVLAYLADFALEKNSYRGIPREITVETLRDVNIWLKNYEDQYHQLGLEQFGWLFLHYTGDLFGLGRLQFRIVKNEGAVPSGETMIETHIPQGQPLNTEACLQSFVRAKDFFSTYFPEVHPAYFFCDSWLLNPNLVQVLGEESNIVRFMRLWQTVPFPPDNSAQAIERVFGFGFPADKLGQAPEHTGLQRKLKAYLLGGGSLNITGGYRKV
ncbi:MAG: hypothetical protein E7293_10680 [Lachnospiraceae bacterium]|nr:hypothetical protein [Lachnospiraceae bacterium]